MKTALAVVCAALLTGCATPGSRIVQIADNTYMHSRLGSFFSYSGSEVKADLYREANQFCTSKGKKLKPLNSNAVDAGYAKHASAEIQFSCE